MVPIIVENSIVEIIDNARNEVILVTGFVESEIDEGDDAADGDGEGGGEGDDGDAEGEGVGGVVGEVKNRSVMGKVKTRRASPVF